MLGFAAEDMLELLTNANCVNFRFVHLHRAFLFTEAHHLNHLVTIFSEMFRSGNTLDID